MKTVLLSLAALLLISCTHATPAPSAAPVPQYPSAIHAGAAILDTIQSLTPPPDPTRPMPPIPVITPFDPSKIHAPDPSVYAPGFQAWDAMTTPRSTPYVAPYVRPQNYYSHTYCGRGGCTTYGWPGN